MAEELKPGDTVRLKSGGEKMTIGSISEDLGTLTAYCVWFDGKKRTEGAFPVVTLEKVGKSDRISTGTFED